MKRFGFFAGSLLIGTMLGGNAFARDAVDANPALDQPVKSPVSVETPPPADARKEATRSYVVEKGDTLGNISKELLGDEKKWKLIARANHIQNPEDLEVGTRLEIPATAMGTMSEKSKTSKQPEQTTPDANRPHPLPRNNAPHP